MPRYLSVVENAYRATVEEQDDTAVWFTHAIRNAGADVGLLLRGNAVCYAQEAQDASGLRFGTRTVTVAPDIGRDIAAVIEKEIPVYVVSEDAAERGVPEGGLLPGVERVSREKLGKLFDDYDRIIHW
jgi:hypothetical protein